MKIYFYKKCGVFEACKKVYDFFDTLRPGAAEMTRPGSVFNFLLHIQNEEILLVCVIDRCAGDPAQLVFCRFVTISSCRRPMRAR